MVVGGSVGIIGTLIATSLFPVDPSVGFGALAAYFSLFGVSAGVVLGAIVALLFDLRSSKKSRMVRADREAIEEPTEPELKAAPELTPEGTALTPEGTALTAEGTAEV